MKKLLTLLIIVAGAAAGWWFSQNQTRTTFNNDEIARGDSQSNTAQTGAAGDAAPNGANQVTIPGDASGESSINLTAQGGEMSEEVRSATEVYQSAEEAVAAAIKGAKDFDDSILEQFTEPGPDCTWCSQFYASIQEIVTNPNTPQDQKSYMAEILAISGRPENVQVLIESIKNAQSTTEADIYAEALELSLGKDDVTRVIGEQLSTTNDTLREASVAAITNQGSRMAAEMLQKHIQERNDPDAYYSVGIGPGEFIPNEEAMPYVQELVSRRDQYSPVWAKAMVNAGLPGLQALFEQLENSPNPEADRPLIKDVIEHVNFEDGIKEAADNVIANNKSPVAVDLAKQIAAGITQQESEEVQGSTEQQGTTEP
jgi:hypothetical protein